MKYLSKKALAVLLAALLALSFSASSFAVWPSFQNGSTNNGVITAQPPIATPATASTVGLSTNNPSGNVYSGIDTTSVINNGVAYTLYNGGVYDAGTGLGGARVAATTLATGSVTNTLLDAQASNDNQLSTPYFDTATNTLYAATQRSSSFYDTSTVAGWTPSGSASISGGTVTFAGGGTTGSIYLNIPVGNPVRYIYLPTNLSSSGSDSGTYTIMLGNKVLASGTLTTYGTYDIYDSAALFTGTNTLKITVNNNSTNVTMNQITLTRYDWRLYSVNYSNATPTVTMVVGNTAIDPLYEGQPNTPISYDVSGNIYWGIYGGTHSYYKYSYGAATPALATFTPTDPSQGYDNFYYAGAVAVTDSKQQNLIVLGGDSGLVYALNPATFTQISTSPIDIGAIVQPTPVTDVGQIRSTMVAPASGTGAGSIYFTSKGTGARGYLWRLNIDSISSAPSVAVNVVDASDTSDSTPVISANTTAAGNNLLYVGTSAYNATTFATEGTVQAYDTALAQVAFIYGGGTPAGDPVQSSPIVYSDTDDEIDYIYFTTNSGSGAGYCYSSDGSTAAQAWTYANTSANKYSVQGMASDGGYVVWGDDGNNLYIAH